MTRLSLPQDVICLIAPHLINHPRPTVSPFQTKQITPFSTCRPTPLDAASAELCSSSATAAPTATTLSAATASKHPLDTVPTTELGVSDCSFHLTVPAGSTTKVGHGLLAALLEPSACAACTPLRLHSEDADAAPEPAAWLDGRHPQLSCDGVHWPGAVKFVLELA